MTESKSLDETTGPVTTSALVPYLPPEGLERPQLATASTEGVGSNTAVVEVSRSSGLSVRRATKSLTASLDLILLGLCAATGTWFLFNPVHSVGVWLAATYIALPVTACIAYRVRRVHRSAYGALEFAIGFVAGAGAFVGGTTNQESIKFLACVASIYVMVRGLESVAVGSTSLNKKRWWKTGFGTEQSQVSSRGDR